jgi:hypothetical protein
VKTGPTPLSEEFIGVYHDVIPQSEIAFIQRFAGHQMAALGYKLDAVHLSPAQWLRYALFDWPVNLLRMAVWLLRERLQHHFPSLWGRKPDPRLMVDSHGSPGRKRGKRIHAEIT